MARRGRKVDESPDMSAMLKSLSEGVKKQSREPDIHGYKPHNKQIRFHASEKKGRLYIGGNRSGKTTGGVTEDLWWIKGNHPYRKVPDGPIRGRVVGVDFLNGISKIILPQFARWTPPSYLINGSWEDSYNKSERTLTFANESFIEFMSYDQDVDKFAGTSRHFIHYDEEPPKYVFNECQARLVDTNGDWWLTMTPVEGMTWVHEDIYAPSDEGQNPLIDIIHVDMGENPHLSAEAIQNFLSTLSEDERNAREHGHFIQTAGLVYKGFDSNGVHTFPGSFVPKQAPPGTDFYIGMDHGWRNPTAFLWNAVLPSGQIITFDEHYVTEQTIEQHVEAVTAKNKAYGIVEPTYIGDPAIKQTSGITGTSVYTEYAIRGIPIATADNRVEIGVPKVQSYLRVRSNGQPTWKITENCVNLRREMKNLRWAKYESKKMQFENNPQEKIHKKDDHAADAIRYFFTFMPELTPEPLKAPLPHIPTGDAIQGNFDTMLAKMKLEPEIRWAVEQAESNLWTAENDFEYERG